jgi:two-component system, cell cycle sensor histidine kinase and response regulator CckA
MTYPRDEHSFRVLQALLESTDVMVCALDAENLVLRTFNSALARLFAKRNGTQLRAGATLDDIFGRDEADAWRAHFLRALTNGPFGIEHHGLVEGRTFWLSFNKVMADGVCLGVSLFCRDITEIQHTVRLGKSAEERFASLFRANPCPLQVNDAETGVMVDVNDAFAQWLGYQRAELIGHSTLDFDIWVDPPLRQSLAEIVQSTGRVAGFETRYRHRDGRVLHGLISCETIVLEGRRCFLVSTADISTLRVAEQSLRESELRNRVLIETAPEAIVVIDAETGQFVDANENAARMSGYDKPTLLSLKPAELGRSLPPPATPSASAGGNYRERAAAGEPQTFEWSYLRPDGKKVECEVRLSSLEDGRRKLLRASVIDITERKRLEREATALRAQLAHAQRMEALGRLSSGIAHDFNNLLGAIMGHLDLALASPPGSDVRPQLEDIQQAAQRAVHLVRQIRAFGRQKRDKKPVRVAPVVKEAVKLIRVDLPVNVSLKEQYTSSGWVSSDPTQIHQVVVNLFTNARLALADRGGTIEVRVEDRHLDTRLIPQYPWAKPGPHLCLTVNDSGCGIAPETLERIFDPFFTTRAEGEGTGLGLSVVYGIVKDVGGAIDVKSEPGSGSSFAVYLPLSGSGPA